MIQSNIKSLRVDEKIIANNQSKIENNIPGKFYVDEICIGCCQCRDIISDIFKEDAG